MAMIYFCNVISAITGQISDVRASVAIRKQDRNFLATHSASNATYMPARKPQMSWLARGCGLALLLALQGCVLGDLGVTDSSPSSRQALYALMIHRRHWAHASIRWCWPSMAVNTATRKLKRWLPLSLGD
ncbi:MAG: hypothetical protein R3D29_16055 [Nitratireductor sp.]